MIIPRFIPLFLAINGAYAISKSEGQDTLVQIDSSAIIQPQLATMVVQDSASWLVSEFTGAIGCSEIRLAGSPVVFHEGETARLRANWGFELARRDSAMAAACAKVRRFRRIDRLPPMAVADSVDFCHDGNCLTKEIAKVRIPPNDPSSCMDGMPAPLATHAQAVEYLNSRLSLARAVLRLGRFIMFPPPNDDTSWMPWEEGFFAPGHCPDTLHLPYYRWVGSMGGNIGALRIWSDPRVPSELALPSPGNAADLFGEEVVQFRVDTLAGSSVIGDSRFFDRKTWNYSTGAKAYFYQGDWTPQTSSCGSRSNVPAIFADTLATAGKGLFVSNQKPTCGRKDVDVFAAAVGSWIVALPVTGEPIETVFKHYAAAENAWSWPLEGDTVLVRGQKVLISEIASSTGVARRASDRVGFITAQAGHKLSVELAGAGELRVLDASGRILVRQFLASGKSEVSLPPASRGLLVVQVGSWRKTIVVP